MAAQLSTSSMVRDNIMWYNIFMPRNFGRYLIGVGLIIFAIILIIIGFNIFKNIFTSDTPDQQTLTSKKVDLLAAPTNNQAVRYTVRGPVVANEKRTSIRFTIDRTKRQLEVLQGYNDSVIKTQQLSNSQESYQAFVAALNGAGFTKAISPDERGDEAQSCPLGQTYSFEIAPGGSDAFRTWSVSCGSKLGTFAGNRIVIEQLFQRQFPDYNEFTSGINLN